VLHRPPPSITRLMRQPMRDVTSNAATLDPCSRRDTTGVTCKPTRGVGPPRLSCEGPYISRVHPRRQPPFERAGEAGSDARGIHRAKEKRLRHGRTHRAREKPPVVHMLSNDPRMRGGPDVREQQRAAADLAAAPAPAPHPNDIAPMGPGASGVTVKLEKEEGGPRPRRDGAAPGPARVPAPGPRTPRVLVKVEDSTSGEDTDGEEEEEEEEGTGAGGEGATGMGRRDRAGREGCCCSRRDRAGRGGCCCTRGRRTSRRTTGVAGRDDLAGRRLPPSDPCRP